MPRSLAVLASRAGEAGSDVAAFFDNLDLFVQRVADQTTETTLLHGDPRPDNLGYSGSPLVAVDWGELTGPGPAEFDVVRFVVGSCRMHTDVEPLEIYDIYNRFSHRPLDTEMLYLAMLWAIANFGVGNFAVIQALDHPELKDRAKSSGRLWLEELQRLRAERSRSGTGRR